MFGYNVRERYEYFNELMFFNTLPDDFEIGWRKNTVSLGLVNGHHHFNSDGELVGWTPLYLHLSSRFLGNVTDRDRDIVLVHEMTHVYINNQPSLYLNSLKRQTINPHDRLFYNVNRTIAQPHGLADSLKNHSKAFKSNLDKIEWAANGDIESYKGKKIKW